MKIRWTVMFFLLLSFVLGAQAKEAVPIEDPAIKERLKALTSELRCLKCQNQTIYDSKAGLADDLRRQVRTQINTGKTNDEIIEYMVSRYGEFVRYNPAVNAKNLLLWIGPLLFLVIGGGILFMQLRKRQTLVLDTPLSDEESTRVAKLLQQSGDKS